MPAQPFEIFKIAGFTKGTAALCRQPATDADYAMIAAWAPAIVVTLTLEDEFTHTGKFLPLRFLEAKYDWLHLPITDFGVPANKDCALWQDALGQLQAVLDTNGRVLAHCKAGRGRSGMLILKLLTLQGEPGETALARIRTIRGGAVETEAQYNWATKPL